MSTPRAWLLRAACAASVIAFSAAQTSPPPGGETIHYVYDARGRLVEVERIQPTATVKTAYGHDRADNRTRKEVAIAP